MVEVDMTTLKFVPVSDLTRHFNSGRFKNEATVILTGLGMAFNSPPEYIVVVDRTDIGVCWQCDLEDVLKNLDPTVDTLRTNPNLLVFQNGLRQMVAMREAVMARKAEYARSAQIIPLFGVR